MELCKPAIALTPYKDILFNFYSSALIFKYDEWSKPNIACIQLKTILF